MVLGFLLPCWVAFSPQNWIGCVGRALFCSLDSPPFPLALLFPSPSFCRSQVFGFIRQEIALAAAATAPGAGAAAAPPPFGAKNNGEGEGESGGGDAVEVELADKRDVVLSKLPQLMELNKVDTAARVAPRLRFRSCLRCPPENTCGTFSGVALFFRGHKQASGHVEGMGWGDKNINKKIR